MHPDTIEQAEQLQHQLRTRVDVTTGLPHPPRVVAGLDVSYVRGSSRVAAAAVALSFPDLTIVDSAITFGEATFPYVPGLLAFREVPVLMEALAALAAPPDVLVCDGYGIAHPRRFGLACHLGVLTGLPAFGVAKTAFTAGFTLPAAERGSRSPLVEGTETLGHALRTQTAVKPVFVSPGHRITLAEATDLTLALCREFRLPEPIRQADHLSREALSTGGSDR